MAPVKTFIVALFCCIALLSAMPAHAGKFLNGLLSNGLASNGLASNGLVSNGLTASEGAPIEGPRDGLPFVLISQRALGKTHP